MTKTNFQQKTVLILSSTLITLVALEILLRAGGILYLSAIELQNKKNFQKENNLRILCLGESTTANGGKFSYPNQLNNILNKQLKGKSVQVINKGIPAKNTDYIVSQAPSWIEEYKPDMAIIMMGINDSSEFIPHDEIDPYLHFIKNLRVYKLMLWIQSNLKVKLAAQTKPKKQNNIVPPLEKPQKPSLTVNQKKIAPPLTVNQKKIVPPPATHKPLKMLATESIMNVSPLYHRILILGMRHEQVGELEKAARIYEQLINANISQTATQWLENKVGNLYLRQGEYNKIFPLIEKKLKTNPFNVQVAGWLPTIYKNKNSVKQLIPMIEKFSRAYPDIPLFYDILTIAYASLDHHEKSSLNSEKAENIRRNTYNSNTQSNYEKLITLLQEKNIKIIVMQYPLRNLENLKKMLRTKFDLSNFLFVDNEAPFQKAIHEKNYDVYFKDRFAGNFGHRTNEGHHLIAENIVKVLKREFF